MESLLYFIIFSDANLTRRLLVSSEDELERITHQADYEAIEVMAINQQVVQIQVRKHQGYENISRRTNVVSKKKKQNFPFIKIL